MSTVWYAALQTAATEWDEQHDALYGARNSLDAVEVGDLGATVKPHAEEFVRVWRAEIHALVGAAEDHATALRDAGYTWAATDQASVDALQQLLPWDQRNLTPQPTGLQP